MCHNYSPYGALKNAPNPLPPRLERCRRALQRITDSLQRSKTQFIVLKLYRNFVLPHRQLVTIALILHEINGNTALNC